MHLHYFQHVPFETPGFIQTWAAQQEHTLSGTALWQNSALPAHEECDALIILGGPMGVHDEAKYSWLAAEKAHIGTAMASGKPVLGICLGAQLMADALGAKVTKNPHKEIGWFPLMLTDEAKHHTRLAGLTDGMMALHWHGDTFAIPDGAIRIASSAACANQGFVKGRALALQFHLEMTAESLKAIADACRDELAADSYVQSYEEILRQPQYIADSNAAMAALLNRWLQ